MSGPLNPERKVMKALTAIGGVFVAEVRLPMIIRQQVDHLANKLVRDGARPESISFSTYVAQDTVHIVLLGFVPE
jgi:hypothetical protein